ncbi:MAG: class I SAM-dependent methyltransferase, partial [Bacteroidia bacterium]
MKESADQLQPGINPAQFKHADGEKIPFDDNQFDAVLSSAVLHFARDKAHFDAMLQELVRVLAPGGLLLIRTAWQPANEVTVQPLGNDHFLHPDGMDYFIAPYSVDDFCAKLNELGITLTESAKVTQVHRLRAMSTFVGMKE